MKKLYMVLMVFAVLVAVSQPVWAQSPAAVAARAQQLGRALPLVANAAPQHARPFIWVSRFLGFKPAPVGLPSFCNIPRSGGGFQFCPNAMVAAYGVDKIVGANGGQGMTVAIVDAFYYANAEADLNTFSSVMGLPACTTGNGCFKHVFQDGGPPGGPSDANWELETMLDIEWAHAMAPKAKILLVHSYDNYNNNLYPAVQYAYNHADIVSNSWGGGEWSGQSAADPIWQASPVPLFFSSGDWTASNTIYPCTSPYTTCIGGTTLSVNPTTFQRISETAWADGGGNCSSVEPAQWWQNPVNPCGSYRAAPDISADADPNTGAIVYDSGNGGYWLVGGTSLSSPLLAGVFADIMAARVSFGKPKFGFLNPSLYNGAVRNYPYFYFDVVAGNNGNPAGPGYDLATGLGVPVSAAMANRFFGLLYPIAPPPPPD